MAGRQPLLHNQYPGHQAPYYYGGIQNQGQPQYGTYGPTVPPPAPYYGTPRPPVPHHYGYYRQPAPPPPQPTDIYRPVPEEEEGGDGARREIANLPPAETCPRGAVPLPKEAVVRSYICPSVTLCIISLVLLMLPVIPLAVCAVVCSIAAIKQQDKMKYESANKKGTCALGCMIVSIPVGIGWIITVIIVAFILFISGVFAGTQAPQNYN